MAFRLHYVHILILLLLASPAQAATDFTADANCMGAWLMTSAGSETDLSGEGGTLTESASDDIPTGTSDTPYATGSSRDWELADTEWLEHADSTSTDISGADQKMSIVMWIKKESNAGNFLLVGKYDWDTGGQLQYRMRSTSTDKIDATISNDGSATTTATSSSTVQISDGWTHVALVYNDVDMRIYIDGALDGTPAAHTSGIFNSTSKFCVGAIACGQTADVYYDGRITELGIFDRDLSAAEVLAIKNDGIDGSFASGRRIIMQQ